MMKWIEEDKDTVILKFSIEGVETNVLKIIPFEKGYLITLTKIGCIMLGNKLDCTFLNTTVLKKAKEDASKILVKNIKKSLKGCDITDFWGEVIEFLEKETD